jgi:tRNA-binding protein
MAGRAGEPAAGMTITIDDFLKVDVRVGTIVEAVLNEGARKPAYRLVVDFGPEFGRRRSSAQLVANYRPEELVGRQVAAVVNFPPRQIAQSISEVLVLGFPDAVGEVVLVAVERSVPDGGRLY